MARIFRECAHCWAPERFDRLRRRYLDDCPSESFTMRNLGRHLAGWMERIRRWLGRTSRVALDMAKLEWAEIESFDAAEHERLEPRRCCRSRARQHAAGFNPM